MTEKEVIKISNKEHNSNTALKIKSEQQNKEIKDLKRSLKFTQDSLEEIRDSNNSLKIENSLLRSKISMFNFHTTIKFIAGVIMVGLGINYFTNGNYIFGIILFSIGTFIYFKIESFDYKSSL